MKCTPHLKTLYTRLAILIKKNVYTILHKLPLFIYAN